MPTTVNNNNDNHWSVDKRIPLALILTLLLQTGGFAFWMGQLTTRLAQVEKTVDAGATNGDRLTRVEVKLETINSAINRVENQLRSNR